MIFALPLEAGVWELDTGHWRLGTGHWDLETGDWAVRSRLVDRSSVSQSQAAQTSLRSLAVSWQVVASELGVCGRFVTVLAVAW